jgi:two-component sensor histidine kinase
VTSVAELVREHTALSEDDLRWLTALLGEWHLLSDLSFADLVLWLPKADQSGYVAGAQLRPTTGPTSYAQDMVGRVMDVGRRPLVDGAFESGRIRRDSDPEWWDAIPVRIEAIPVCRQGRTIAVINRTTNLVAVRTPSRLEMVYLETAGLLARMIAEGRFPQVADVAPARRGDPRVGDGLIRVDPQGVVGFASPNAMSAFRRLGLVGDLVGHPLGTVVRELTDDLAGEPLDEGLDPALSGHGSREMEIASGTATLTARVIPLDPGGTSSGAIVLVRDVTELRRRDAELLSKDATIREIHHRVKNNLQTVASLLRLQSRRVGDPAAQAALREAVQRVRAIAVVHEMLAERTDEDVDLDMVLDRLTGMTTEVTAREGVTIVREGRAGRAPAVLATPVAMAVAELLANAVEHGLADRAGTVTVTARRSERDLVVGVEDDGWGVPAGVDPEASASLGLRIVTTLVAERGGTFSLVPRSPGTRAELCVPVGAGGG